MPDLGSVGKEAAEEQRLTHLVETPDTVWEVCRGLVYFWEMVLMASSSGGFHKTFQERKRKKKEMGKEALDYTRLKDITVWVFLITLSIDLPCNTSHNLFPTY